MNRLHAVLVLCLPLLLVLKVSASTLHVVPGSILALPCLPNQRSLGWGTASWKFNGTPVPEGSGSQVDKGDGLELVISPVTASSQGEYECTFVQNNVEWKKTYSVEVDATSSYVLKVLEGPDDVILPCDRPDSPQADGYALWFKETPDGQRTRLYPMEAGNATDPRASERLEWVYGDPRFSDQSVALHLPNVGDMGVYHCESAEGKMFNTITLLVEAPPIPAAHSCHGFDTPWEQCPDEDSRSWPAILEESLTEFSMKVYAHLSRSRPSKNLLFSPISMSGVLTHLLLGARDVTRKRLEDVLCLPHDFYCVHSQMKKLKQRLQDSLKMASQIYHSQDINPSETFANQSLQFYDAEPVELTNSSVKNTEMINSWVAKHTNNKIKHLVDSVHPDTQLILLNAVSFSGQWKVKFDGKEKNAPFTKLNGDIVKVPILYSSRYMVAVEYVSTVKAQVAVFPLSGESSLFILLPPTGALSDLQLVEGKLTDAAVRHMVAQMRAAPAQSTEVTLPKIRLDVPTEMNDLLVKLGLTTLFESPNLCGMFPDRPLALTDARHRAFLALSEAGVEAGAVTSLSFSRSFSAFSALRPFVLLLWSDAANQPLFMGRVTQP